MKRNKRKKKRSHVFSNSLIIFSTMLFIAFVVIASTPDKHVEIILPAPTPTYQPSATQIASSVNQTSSNGSYNRISIHKPSNNVDKYDVIAAAKDIVKEGMYNPKSADFPWGADEYNITEHDGVWYVQGYVYGTNAYGAEVKSEWLAIFELEKAKDGYRIFNYSLGWF